MPNLSASVRTLSGRTEYRPTTSLRGTAGAIARGVTKQPRRQCMHARPDKREEVATTRPLHKPLCGPRDYIKDDCFH
jgi:hypothetical protein